MVERATVLHAYEGLRKLEQGHIQGKMTCVRIQEGNKNMQFEATFARDLRSGMPHLFHL